ncbi:MAG TPA: hypothetical protein VN153_07625 [Tahibacter sp.]|nr:hypothetical protein [Tahibacter sp.]
MSTGHAFSLHSLLHVHGNASEEALWASMRVLQEKIALLKRIAAENPTTNSETAAQALAEAEQLSEIVSR